MEIDIVLDVSIMPNLIGNTYMFVEIYLFDLNLQIFLWYNNSGKTISLLCGIRI